MKIIKLIQKSKYLFIINIIFIIDYCSKNYIISNLRKNEKKVINAFLNIKNIQNYGLIFGVLEKKIKNNTLLFYSINLFLLTLIILIIYFFLKKNNSNKLIYTLLLSGALGNLFNRLKYGYIIDFFDVHYKWYHLPTFNISDISIFLSLILFILK
ncbi:signal peptidase II [Buchnera aphidicola]|uniref:signal peptidase II n=1 Tax=Buchnera aphidicola TaxID=9 RepID=UPI002092417C|nr:signal peptidase II [Buchnera aphidicola]USS94232.1 signal peptidase II [Buchnera aphidicola (Sipha maydis)]WII23781.1 signal peptidase II [Buchnera aphidicola (Sipha maydis)]